MWMCLGRDAKDKADVTADVPEAVVKPAVTAQGATSPSVSAHDEATAISEPRADEDASSVLGMVVAGAGRPPRLPWAGPCWLDVLGGLVSPWG
jgi:hypothetical protein